MRRGTIRPMLALAALLSLVCAAAPASGSSDTEQAVQKALVDKLGGDASTIRAAFYDGKVVLSGKVAEDATQELAKEVALWVPGVTKVENQVEAAKERSVGTGKILAESDDASLESAVKSALKGEIGSHSTGLEVEACNGVVSVRGTVPDQARYDLALAAAKKVAKVEKVVDLLRIAG